MEDVCCRLGCSYHYIWRQLHHHHHHLISAKRRPPRLNIDLSSSNNRDNKWILTDYNQHRRRLKQFGEERIANYNFEVARKLFEGKNFLLFAGLRWCWCLRYYVCRKMTAAKMVSVRFLPRDASAERGYEIACRPSVTFRYQQHIGWNSPKIISRPNSLGPLLWLTPNMGDLVQREHPQN